MIKGVVIIVIEDSGLGPRVLDPDINGNKTISDMDYTRLCLAILERCYTLTFLNYRKSIQLLRLKYKHPEHYSWESAIENADGNNLRVNVVPASCS